MLQDSDSGFYRRKSIGRYGEDVLPYLERHNYEAKVLETRCEAVILRNFGSHVVCGFSGDR